MVIYDLFQGPLSSHSFQSCPYLFLGRSLGTDATWHNDHNVNHPHNYMWLVRLFFSFVGNLCGSGRDNDSAIFSPWLWSVQVKAEAGQGGWTGIIIWLEFSCLLAKTLLTISFQQVLDNLLRTCVYTLQAHVKKDYLTCCNPNTSQYGHQVSPQWRNNMRSDN